MSDAAELGKDLAAWALSKNSTLGRTFRLAEFMRNNLPAILDALSVKAAVDEMQDQSEPPDHKHDAMMRELGRALEGRARHIRETWEQR